MTVLLSEPEAERLQTFLRLGSGRVRPATYRLGTPRSQPHVIARWQVHLHSLATPIPEIPGLAPAPRQKFVHPEFVDIFP